MVTTLIITVILTVFFIGIVQVYNRRSRVINKIDFANKYRNIFVEFANKYFKNYSHLSGLGNLDEEIYVWLTLNVTKIQGDLGTLGVMEYIAPFKAYSISNYQIIINTIPKFRDGSVTNFDVNSVDDCLLRYIGDLNGISSETDKNMKNPIIWFREGIREIISVPIFFLNWFGIISNSTVNSIKNSLIFKVIAGLFSLITFFSALVTIIVGYDQIIELINRLLEK